MRPLHSFLFWFSFTLTVTLALFGFRYLMRLLGTWLVRRFLVSKGVHGREGT